MAILLTFLKVIGIILLVILGLVLLIVSIVLFCPIRYGIEGNLYDTGTWAKANVRFLIVKALGGYDKDDGLDYKIKILGFQVYPKKDTDEPKEEEEEDLLEFPEYDDELDDSDLVSHAESTSETVQANETESTSLPAEPEHKPEPPVTSSDTSESTVQEEPKETLDDKLYKLSENLEKKLDENQRKVNDAKKKVDHIMQFLDRDYVQRTISRILKILKILLKTIKPKKSKGYIHFGMSSPADTGDMLGKISAFYPLYGKWLNINPDFDYKVIEGDLNIKGRIRLYHIAFPVVWMLIGRDFRRTYKLAKKI